MRKFVLTLMLAFVLLTAFGGVSAQWDVTCPAPEGDYTRGGVFPRYEYRNRRLILVDIQTHEVVRELETSLETPEFRFVSWSPDCRYLIAAIGDGSGYSTLLTVIIWNVETSTRIGEFSNSHPEILGTYWHPNSRYVIVNVLQGAYLFDTLTSSNYFLAGGPIDEYFNRDGFNSVHWDDTRQQIIAVLVNGDTAIYDLNDGHVIYYFTNPDGGGDPAFVLSQDETKIAVFSILHGSYFVIRDQDTLRETQLNTNGLSPDYATQVSFSPSNRYLAVASLYRVRIWDLSVMQSPNPIYTYTIIPYPRSILFLDENIVETTQIDGNVQRWNIHTGEAIGEPIPAA